MGAELGSPPPPPPPAPGAPAGKADASSLAQAVWFQRVQQLINDQVTLIGTTAQRPTTGNYARRSYMDTTLAAAGKMIWRNATNTGWVDATGAAV